MRSTTDRPAIARPRKDAFAYLGFALFALTVLLSLAAVKLGLARVPLRTVTLIASGACMVLSDWSLFRTALRRAAKLLSVLVVLALLGTVVSVLAGNKPIDMFQQLAEVHSQAIVGTVVAYMLVLRFGVRSVLSVFLVIFAVDVVVAAAQAVGLNAAWQLRAQIGAVMHDPVLTRYIYESRYRPLGFSYTPILFATQSCLAVAALYYLRVADGRPPRGRVDVWLLVGTLACALACVATGNRSPLLGFAVFLAVYLILQAPAVAVALLPLGMLAAVTLLPLISQHAEQVGIRALDLENGSSSNRGTLREFGLFLIRQQPLGYGLVFNSTQHWQAFYDQVIYMPNPSSIRLWALHNYFLIMVAKYGVLLLGLIPWILPRTREQAWLWLPFAPYLVHIFYHNEGPLLNDFLIFYLLPAAMEIARNAQQRAESAAPRPTPWRRAFASPAAADA
jgi:hypothetical protein